MTNIRYAITVLIESRGDKNAVVCDANGIWGQPPNSLPSSEEGLGF